MGAALLLLKGFLIGFAIAAPVGPVGVLCIRTTLVRGWLSGFATGAGAALADTVYGAVAAFGLTFVIVFLQRYSQALSIAAGLLLFALAWRTMKQSPAAELGLQPESSKSLLLATGSTFAVTLTNPATIISFLVIFSAMGLVKNDVPHAAIMVAGVFAGSLSWWLCLSSGVRLARMKMTEKTVGRINAVSAAVIAAFGAVVLFSALGSFLS